MYIKQIVCIVITSLLVGCVKVPVQSVRLNQIVNENIQDLHQKHVKLAHEYFKLKVELFNEWFMEEYEPAYKINYQRIWNQRRPNEQFDLTNSTHRKQYVQDYIAEHDEFIAQINTFESDLVAKLDTGYSDLVRANEAVTVLLRSAKTLTDQERKFWNNSVGRVFPAFEVEKIDSRITAIQQTAIKALAGN